MITYYTALGRFTFEQQDNGKKVAAVFVKEDKYYLDPNEFLVWNSLLWTLKSYDDLKKEFHAKREELRLFDDISFDGVLNRLRQRNLVVLGESLVAAEAKYDLVKTLHIRPVKTSFVNRLLGAACQLQKNEVTHKEAFRGLGEYKPTAQEKLILNLIASVPLTAAEIIACLDDDIIRIHSEEELVDLIYQEDKTCDNLPAYSQLSDLRPKLVEAIIHLYENRQILLET